VEAPANVPQMTYMTKCLAAFLALSTTAVTPAIADPVQDALEGDDLAWDIVEGLTTEIGPRQAGTEAEARARLWALAKLESLGFDNVRSEEFQMQTWVRGEETAAVTSPFPQKMAITALGNSASTGESGLTAQVRYFPTLADLKAVDDGSLAGKIAFVSHTMRRTQDGSGYGFAGPVRWVGPSIASTKGAAAIVIKSVGTDNHRNPHTGGTRFPEGVKPIPAGALSIPDAENLERMFLRGVPIEMALKLTPRDIGMQTSGNVIAEVTGSDKSLPPILIACHLDSWDLGTGAMDDGVGCAIITAAALHVKKAGQPKRTIRLLWAGAEEVGVWGGKAYAEKHRDEPHALAMESDFGADRVWRVEFKLPDGAKKLSDTIAARLVKLGVVRGTIPASGGADIRPIIAEQNLAIIDLQQDGTRYFDLHHTPDDTLDKVDKAQLRQNVAAWIAVLQLVANYEGKLKMEPKP